MALGGEIVYSTTVKKHEMKYTGEYWMKMTYPNLKILDFDGWDRTNLNYSFKKEQITYMEFMRRLCSCTGEGTLGGWDTDIAFKEDPDEFFKK